LESGAETRGRIFCLWEVSIPDYIQAWSVLSLDLKTYDVLHLIVGESCQEDAGQLKTRIEAFAGQVRKK
jgi:hypothetical protein